ncbi:MAG TPA: hypothetical protein VLJ37_02420 [bacterium]|nr:hypothetical protein [bacterium]
MQMRNQSGDQKTPLLSNIGFSDYLMASAAPATAALAMNQGYNTAAVTQAAVTGVAGAPASFGGSAANAPYYSPTVGTASPFGSGGYSYGGATYSPGYVGVGAGVGGGVPGSYGVGAGAGYGAPGAPSQDYQEKQALFQQMNDANWEMLVAQVTVNDLSRDYQARSNILKTKSDAEANSVRNMKA